MQKINLENLSAKIVVILLLISLAGLQAVEVAEANPFTYSPPKLAIPEFTLKYVGNSYNVAGNFVQNKSIEVTIKNQPSVYVLCYNVNSKSHFSENWTSYEYYNDNSYVQNRLLASNSDYTVLVFGFEENNGSDTYTLMLGRLHGGDQIDFQVQAYIGNWFPVKEVNGLTGSSIEYNLLNIDAIGDWSPTQTITIPADYSSIPIPSPTLTPTPIPTTKPILSFDFLSNKLFLTVTLSAIGLVVIVLLVMVYKRRKRAS